MKLISMISATAVAASAGAASAATYTFDFDTGLGTDHASLYVASNEDAGFGVTVQAYNYTINGSGYTLENAADVDAGADGLYSENDELQSIDSYGADELMKFTFDDDREVTLTSIVFSWTEGTGWYDLFADGSLVGNTKNRSVLPAGEANTFSVGARTMAVASWCYSPFYGMYVGCKKYKNSGFMISSITVSYDGPAYQADARLDAAVPLPAAGWLMVGALGGLAALRRRKRKD